MSEEPRRSGRSTKGQHTKNQEETTTATTAPVPPPKEKKGKGRKSAAKAQPEEEEEEEEAEEEGDVIRCVCGTQRETGDFVACDQCKVWQHNHCMGLDPSIDYENETYFCEQCKPENHKELLEAISRGEQPWKRRKGRGKKGGATKLRPSEVKSEVSEKDNEEEQNAVSTIDQNGEVAEKDDVHGNEEEQKAPAELGKRKRRDTQAEGQAAGKEKKRRKSEPLTDPSQLPNDRKRLVETFIKDFQALIKPQVKKGSFRVPDEYTEASYCTHVGMELDDALFKNHGELKGKDSPFFKQFTAIKFNVKKNPLLLERILTKTLILEELARMSSEDMASEERQKQDAAIRAENDKQIIMIQDEGPRIRKTHKGEEYIVEDENPRGGADDAVFTTSTVRHREVEESEDSKKDADSPMENGSPERVELPEDVGSRRPLTVDTAATSRSRAAGRSSSGTFNIQSVWSSVHSPDQDHQRHQSMSTRRQSSITVPPQQQSAVEDADIDRLLKDEDNDSQTYSPMDYTSDQSVVWQGNIRMPSVAALACVARHVAGGDIGQKIPWNSLLPSQPGITGRIDIKRASEYIESLRSSETTDIAVLSLTPVNDGAYENMSKICTYFLQRERWGVIADDRPQTMVRDIYIIPVPAGARKPDFLDMLEFCNVELPAPREMLLLAIIARIASPHQSAAPTPQLNQSMGAPASAPQQFPAPAGTPSNYTGGHYSLPQQSPFSPPPSTIGARRVAEILGDFVNTPVAQQILGEVDSHGEESLLNLRHIFERVPAATMDMNVLMGELAKRNEGSV